MIVGWFQEDALHPIPRINVALWLPKISESWAVVPFVLDTGAAVTCLHPNDALLRAGIAPIMLGDPLRWPAMATYQGIGGNVRYFKSPVQYRLEHNDASMQLLDGTIHVAPWSRETSPLPSVLGWDVLRHFRVVLDWSLGLVELHPLPTE